MSQCNFSDPIRQQISQPEKDAVLRLARKVDAKVILEIGAWVGDSTSSLAQYAKEVGGVVYVVDWFGGNPGTHLEPVAQDKDIYSIFRRNIAALDLSSYVKVLHMTSMEAALIAGSEVFDFIFLDADHTYEHVKHDLNAWYPKLRPGGVFCGHDYDSVIYDEAHIHQDTYGGRHNGLIKAVNEYFGSNKIRREAGSIWWAQK